MGTFRWIGAIAVRLFVRGLSGRINISQKSQGLRLLTNQLIPIAKINSGFLPSL